MDDAFRAELAGVCRAVGDLLRAQESLIEALRARGLLDARASGVLAAIDQLRAEADEAGCRADLPRAASAPGRPAPR